MIISVFSVGNFFVAVYRFTLLLIFSLFITSLKITLLRESSGLEIIIDYLHSNKQTKTNGACVSSSIVPLRISLVTESS